MDGLGKETGIIITFWGMGFWDQPPDASTVEFLDAVVGTIRDVHVAPGIHRYARRVLKLAVAGPDTSPLSQIITRRVELFNPVVAGINHENIPVGIRGDP